MLSSLQDLPLGDAVAGADRPQDPAGVADGDDSGGNVARDDAARADHRTVADPHAAQDGRMAADPYVVADRDGVCAHDAGMALGGIQGVRDGVEPAVGPDEDAVADLDGRLVEDRQAEVADEVLADGDLRAEVAVERAVDREMLAHAAEHFAEDCLAFGLARRGEGIQGEDPLLGRAEGCRDLRPDAVEPAARFHLVKVVHVGSQLDIRR